MDFIKLPTTKAPTYWSLIFVLSSCIGLVFDIPFITLCSFFLLDSFREFVYNLYKPNIEKKYENIVEHAVFALLILLCNGINTVYAACFSYMFCTHLLCTSLIWDKSYKSEKNVAEKVIYKILKFFGTPDELTTQFTLAILGFVTSLLIIL